MGDSPPISRAGNPAFIQALIGLAAFAAVLELAPRLGLVSPRYLPPLSTIAVALAEEMQRPNFRAALAFTMRS